MSELALHLGWACLGVSLLGAVYALVCGLLVRRHLAGAHEGPSAFPPLTLLKPLHGDEPGLYGNLQSFCLQDYPGPIQIVFGVQDFADPAIAVVRALQRRHPNLAIDLVIDAAEHGHNRKVSNLINMSRAVRHEVLVLSDSDIWVEPDYLRRVVAALSRPGVGFVSCLYTGADTASLPSILSAMGISYQFLPNVALGLAAGMARPCFGSTIALRRSVLAEIGGFEAFADRLADDYDLGQAVWSRGYRGAVPAFAVVHVCREPTFRELFAHEVRWARTIRAIDPGGFFGCGFTHALPWALAGWALTGFRFYGLAVVAVAVSARWMLAHEVDGATGRPAGSGLLLPLRDLLSFGVFVAAFFANSVRWSGRRFTVAADGALTSTEELSDAAHPVPAGSLLRRLRRRGGLALPGQARDQVLLVPDLAGPARGHGGEQPADRRPAP